MMVCEYCEKLIDTDFDSEHFIRCKIDYNRLNEYSGFDDDNNEEVSDD